MSALAKINPGSVTADQGSIQNSGTVVFGSLYGGATSRSIDNGTYRTYRRMRMDPTIALARAVALSPIKASGCSVEAKDDATDEMIDLVNVSMLPILKPLISDMTYGVDYGWSPFEVVWSIDGGAAKIERMKPLLVDNSEILVEKSNGNFSGVKNYETVLDKRYSFVYTHDRECGDLYGRSRHENVRELAWRPWCEAMEQTGKYIRKTAGVIPIVRYPAGVSNTINGERPNEDIARMMIEQLGNAKGMAIPNLIGKFYSDLIAQGVDVKGLNPWSIEFLEAKTDHAGGLTTMLRYFDSLKMRGWLVPERVATEGQHGTLAEAGAHADVAMTIAEETLGDMYHQINHGPVDELLAVNFGESARGLVELVPQPLVDSEKAFIRGLMVQVITNPVAYDTASMILDVDALLDVAGLPKAEEVVDTATTTTPGDPANPRPVATTGLSASRRGGVVLGRSAREIFARVAAGKHGMGKAIGGVIEVEP